MNGFDWIIAAIFLLSIIIGIMRGFVREVLSITSWIVAIWLAITYCVPAGDLIGQTISIPADWFRMAAGFALIFIVSLLVFSVISYAIIKLMIKKPIKGVDRVLGIGFGALRAAVIVVAILLFGRGMGLENTQWWQESNYLNKFEGAANYVEELLPPQLQSSSTKADQSTGIESTELSSEEL